MHFGWFWLVSFSYKNLSWSCSENFFEIFLRFLPAIRLTATFPALFLRPPSRFLVSEKKVLTFGYTLWYYILARQGYTLLSQK